MYAIVHAVRIQPTRSCTARLSGLQLARTVYLRMRILAYENPGWAKLWDHTLDLGEASMSSV